MKIMNASQASNVVRAREGADDNEQDSALIVRDFELKAAADRCAQAEGAIKKLADAGAGMPRSTAVEARMALRHIRLLRSIAKHYNDTSARARREMSEAQAAATDGLNDDFSELGSQATPRSHRIAADVMQTALFVNLYFLEGSGFDALFVSAESHIRSGRDARSSEEELALLGSRVGGYYYFYFARSSEKLLESCRRVLNVDNWSHHNQSKARAAVEQCDKWCADMGGETLHTWSAARAESKGWRCFLGNLTALPEDCGAQDKSHAPP